MSQFMRRATRVLLFIFNESPSAIQYLLRDEFTTPRAAGSVNGTAAEPGPGTRGVTDTANGVSISGGSLQMGGYTINWNPRLNYNTAIARSRGTGLFWRITPPGINIAWVSGFSLNTIDSPKTGINFSVGGNIIHFENNASGSRIFGTYAGATTYDAAIILRASGHQSFYRQANVGANWILGWVGAVDNDATLYVAAGKNTNATGTCLWDFFRIANSGFLAPPLASDGFGSTFGISDGLGHAETTGIGSGGGGVAWTQQVGTWTASSSKAAAATLSGGVAAAIVPLSTANVFALVKVTRSAGQGGLILRWTDSSNYLYAEHDGTNAYLKQVLAGSTTTLITATATYSAGANLVVDVNGTAGRLYYNNALVGTTSSINSGLTATAHGLRSTDTGGIQLDDFVVYAKGAEGQYNLLNQY